MQGHREVTHLDSAFREFVPDDYKVEERVLKLHAPADDRETRLNLYDFLKARLDLPGNVVAINVSLDALGPTKIDVKYYHYKPGERAAGAIP